MEEGVTLATPKSPDVLIIVLDAARSQDIYSDHEGTVLTELPFLSRFARESAVFPQASAVAAWTLPSVASLMTGLYPWDHAVSALGTSSLDPMVPTLAGILRERGYATVLLSANNVVGPRTNLSNGFEQVFVADWWEQYVRLRRAKPKPSTGSERLRASRPPSMRRAPAVEKVLRRGMRTAFRFPEFLESTSEFAQRLVDPTSPPGTTVAPWIEPTLRTVLARVPPSRPILTVIHLNDAHEPYFRPPAASEDRELHSAPMVRQDYMRQIEGRWTPGPEELRTLHELYQRMIRSLDRRVERLIAEFAQFRDLEQSLVLITADHGQAFGEGGWLFHMASPEEALLRVPLFARFPRAGHVGRGRGWTSTVDILPTVLAETGSPSASAYPAYPLSTLLDEDRPTAAWSLGDGLPLHHLQGIVSLSPSVRERLGSRYWLAAYDGPRKLLYHLDTGTFEETTVAVAQEVADRASAAKSEAGLTPLRNEALRLAREVQGQKETWDAKGVSQRLDSWGYGA